MTRFFFALVTLALIAAACNNDNTPHDGFRIAGKIANVPDGSNVYLDRVTYAGISTVDTGKVGKNGKFEVSAKADEESLYRLRYGNEKFVLLIADSLTKDIEIETDTTNMFEKTYSVKGSTKSEQLRRFLTYVNTQNRDLSKLMAEASDTTAADSVLQSRFDAYQTKAMATRQYVIGYADTVNSPVLAIFAVTNFLNPQTDLQEINTLSKKLSTKFPTSGLVTAFAQSLVPRDPAPDPTQDPYAPKQQFANGSALPDINGQTPSGSNVALSSLRGQFVLVDFWASWCRPCRMENPTVVGVYNKYKDKGFTVYSVSLDDKKDKWVEAIAQDKLAWNAHVSDLKGWQSELSRPFGVTSIPTNYLIDREGKVVAFNLRGAALEETLTKFLK